MPCCAFAAFILGQILIGFDAFKRFVLRRDSSEIPSNPASEWRLGMAATAVRRAALPMKWLVVAGSLEVVLALGAAYAVRGHVMHQVSADAAQSVVCRGPRLSPIR